VESNADLIAKGQFSAAYCEESVLRHISASLRERGMNLDAVTIDARE